MKLIIVTTCTATKSSPVSETLHLRDIGLEGGSAVACETRAAAWIQGLERSPHQPRSAHELYRGGHWSASEQALAVARARGFEAELWVLSAGYGLIKADEVILKPYGATFSSPSRADRQQGLPDDSVAPGYAGATRMAYHRAWWRALAAWQPGRAGAPRTLETLASAAGPDACMLVIASDAYLGVVADDLLKAASLLGERLAVVSAGAPAGLKQALGAALMPLDARFVAEVGGALIQLNARAAAWLMARSSPTNFNAATAGAVFAEVNGRLDKPTVSTRDKLTDQDVLTYLREAAAPGGAWASRSELHRRLRETGRACSAERFRGLYELVSRERESTALPLFQGL